MREEFLRKRQRGEGRPLSLRKKEDGQALWAMCAKNQNAFNVTGPAGACDEGNHAWKGSPIFRSQTLIGLCEVGHQLVLARDHNVMGGQHAEHAAAGMVACDTDRAGLGNKKFALGDSRIGGFQCVFFVVVVYAKLSNAAWELWGERVQKVAPMEGDGFPCFGVREGGDSRRRLGQVCTDDQLGAK